MSSMSSNTKAVAVLRQSRGDDDSTSIEVQAERVREHAARQGMTIIAEHEERDVSGGSPLAKRPGLLAAVEAIEAGRASVLLVAYFDRLVRSLKVQTEVVERVERAGGRVLAGDLGAISNASAASELSATVLGAMNSYQRRSTAERTHEAKCNAIRRGVPVGSIADFGYVHEPHVPLTVNDETAPLVARLFSMAADGRSRRSMQEMLREHGHDMTLTALGTLLRSRVPLGEIRYGTHAENKSAHPPIVSVRDWDRAQASIKPRGGRHASDRLLARLGVLRCAECGSRLVVGSGGLANKRAPDYRHARGDNPCKNPCGKISAGTVEAFVEDTVSKSLVKVEGHASSTLAPAQAKVEQAQARLDKVRRIAVLADDEEDAADEIKRHKAVLAEAVAELDDARALAGFTITGCGVWNEIDVTTRRELIAIVLDRVEVRKPARKGESPIARLTPVFAKSIDTALTLALDSIAAAAAEIVADDSDEFELPAPKVVAVAA